MISDEAENELLHLLSLTNRNFICFSENSALLFAETSEKQYYKEIL